MDFDNDERDGSPKSGLAYEVGRGRPPPQHQFKKGSEWRGNRNGRPKDSLNHDTLVRRYFGAKLPIDDPETGRKMNGAEAFVLRVRNDSLKGKPYAVRLANEWLQRQSALDEAKQENKLSRNDEHIIEEALERRLKRQKENSADV